MGFDELYQNYVEAVWGYLIFKLKDRQLAEDILQETFLAVHQGMHKIPKVLSPKAWLLSIAHNKMVDSLRQRQVSESYSSLESIVAQNSEEGSGLFVKEALIQLAETERTIIYGLYLEGLTHKELAQILDIPEGTVKSKAHYARKHLYKWLKEEPKDESTSRL